MQHATCNVQRAAHLRLQLDNVRRFTPGDLVVVHLFGRRAAINSAGRQRSRVAALSGLDTVGRPGFPLASLSESVRKATAKAVALVQLKAKTTDLI